MNLLSRFKNNAPTDLGWKPSELGDKDVAAVKAAVRAKIIAAVDEGKLSKVAAAEINAKIRNIPVAYFVAVLRKLADDATNGLDVAEDAARIGKLLQDGKAGALFKLANERRDAQAAFEASGFSDRRRELIKARDAAQKAFDAVEHDLDVTDARKRHQLQLLEATRQPIAAMDNSSDPELKQFRRLMKDTGDPFAGPILKWENFAV